MQRQRQRPPFPGNWPAQTIGPRWMFTRTANDSSNDIRRAVVNVCGGRRSPEYDDTSTLRAVAASHRNVGMA